MIERECKHHGLTTFRQQKSGKKVSYYCVTCYKERQTRMREEKKLKAIEYKGGKCVRCGYNKCPAALDFHHLEPTGKETNGELRSYSWEKLKAEIDKCILVCSNCHREIHYELNRA